LPTLHLPTVYLVLKGPGGEKGAKRSFAGKWRSQAGAWERE